MPCTDGGVPYPDENPRRIEELTQHLCYVLGRYSRDVSFASMMSDNPMLVAWWAEHQRQDEERRKREQESETRKMYQKSGLAKLTRVERIALGLND